MTGRVSRFLGTRTEPVLELGPQYYLHSLPDDYNKGQEQTLIETQKKEIEMTTQHFNLNDDNFLKAVYRAAFPAYNGRKFQVQWGVTQMSLVNYWESGSKDNYALVNLATMEVVHVPTCHPFFQKELADEWGTRKIEMPVVVVNWHQGRYEYCKIYTSENAPLLEAGTGPDEDMLHLIHCTGKYKASYQGKPLRKLYMMHTFNMTAAQVDALQDRAIDEGWLYKNKALSKAGKNAREMYPLDQMILWRDYPQR